MASYFVSYTKTDRDWAFWLGKELETLDHTPHIHEWEIKSGEDIYAWMEARHDAADHVLCVVSDDYLDAANAPYSALERNAALWQAANKRPGFVLPVVVKPCKLPTLTDHRNRCELFNLPEEVARNRFREFITKPPKPDFVPFPGAVTAVSNIPIRVPEHFLGRDDALSEIEIALARHEGRVAITALHGLRGVGKTVLATAYAEWHAKDYRATWWIRAETESGIRADLVGLGVRLGWVDAEAKEEPALATVMERLAQDGAGILLIYDNAVAADAIRPYLPRGGAARVLVTSNTHNWRGIAQPIQITVWPKDVGAKFLIERTGRTDEQAAAEELSEALGGLPLAHEQAAAYCERLEVPLAEYSRRFAAEPIRMLNTNKDAPTDYHNKTTVAKTFALAMREAATRHPATLTLIVYCALLPSEPIPLFIFEEAREKIFTGPVPAALAGDGLDEAIATLQGFGLVEREVIIDDREPKTETRTIRLHRLVREVAAAGCSDEMRAILQGSLIFALHSVYPSQIYNDPTTWPRARLLDPLALAVVAGDAHVPAGSEPGAVHLLDCLATYREVVLGDYGAARPLYERALKINTEAQGPQHVATITSVNNLATLLLAQGDLPAARPLFERVLKFRKKTLGPKHLDTAISLNNLALLFKKRGNLAKARSLYEEALEIKECELGPVHPGTATSLSNLAGVYQAQGDLATARLLLCRTLMICEERLGIEHPDTAMALNNLGLVRELQGDFAGSRTLFERAVRICETRLGPGHPITAVSLYNLAMLLDKRGKLAAARPLFERALASRERTLGPEHPETAMCLNNYAGLLCKQGDFATARPLCERALAINEKVLGCNDPTTVTVRENLAHLMARPG